MHEASLSFVSIAINTEQSDASSATNSIYNAYLTDKSVVISLRVTRANLFSALKKRTGPVALVR